MFLKVCDPGPFTFTSPLLTQRVMLSHAICRGALAKLENPAHGSLPNQDV